MNGRWLWPCAGFLFGVWVAVAAAEGTLNALVGPQAELASRVNRARAEHHLKPLRGSSELAAVARKHALEMRREGYLSHINPAGQNPLDRARAAGITGFALLAENIGTSSARGNRLAAIVDGWLVSPEHRENLLNPAFNTSGIAVLETADGRTLVVQLYAAFDRSPTP